MGDRFEIHVYLSTVSALGDVTAGMTHMGLHAYFRQHHQDAITGTHIHTHIQTHTHTFIQTNIHIYIYERDS